MNIFMSFFSCVLILSVTCIPTNALESQNAIDNLISFSNKINNFEGEALMQYRNITYKPEQAFLAAEGYADNRLHSDFKGVEQDIDRVKSSTVYGELINSYTKGFYKETFFNLQITNESMRIFHEDSNGEILYESKLEGNQVTIYDNSRTFQKSEPRQRMLPDNGAFTDSLFFLDWVLSLKRPDKENITLTESGLNSYVLTFNHGLEETLIEFKIVNAMFVPTKYKCTFGESNMESTEYTDYEEMSGLYVPKVVKTDFIPLHDLASVTKMQAPFSLIRVLAVK
jgi:hypothetical protein